jgi:leucyl aminopeptidase
MIPTSTLAGTSTSDSIPDRAAAVAVLVYKETKDARRFRQLSEEERSAVNAVLANGTHGKVADVVLQYVHTGKGRSRAVMVAGLGEQKKICAECIRKAGGAIARTARQRKLNQVAVLLPEVPRMLKGHPEAAEEVGPGEEVAADALVSGFVLGSFDFREQKGSASKSNGGDEKPMKVDLTVVADGGSETIGDVVNAARIVAEGQNFARTIALRAGNEINPPELAKVAQQLAKEVGLQARVLDEKQMQKLGMGGILAVGSGSSTTPPRMIVLEWQGSGSGVRGRESRRGRDAASKSDRGRSAPLLVVGKAITFDTGGISIKPAEKMGKMIFDKCGAMAVLGLMYAVAKLKLPAHVVGIMSSAENHIGERAYRPGDILRMYNGVTVEVTNTDAEGRLVLGDALAWGIEQYKPAAVVDLATLTGGVVVALGKSMAGVMSRDDGLVRELSASADAAGERIWRLPLDEHQRDYIKSETADIVNAAGREGHPLQGGAFLSYFVPEGTPWAHLDIAGVAALEKEQPHYVQGATGWGVRTLVEWVRRHGRH